MTSKSGYLKTCDICEFTEFVPGVTITDADRQRWSNVRKWMKVEAEAKLDICSVACLTDWAARGESAE